MKKQSKTILAVCIVGVLIAGTFTYNMVFNSKDKDDKKDKQEEKKPIKEPVKDPDIEKDPQPEEPSNPNENTYKPVIYPSYNEPTYPVIPPVEEKPEKITDLVIDSQSFSSGQVLEIANETYNTITVKNDIPENSYIKLNNVKLNEELILDENTKYVLDIKKSNIPSMTVKTKENTFSLASYGLRRSNTLVNKTIEGPTINLDEDTLISEIIINGTVHINGENIIEKIYVNDGEEVVLNVPASNVLSNMNSYNSSLMINKEVTNLVNDGHNSNIVINENIVELTNNGFYSKIIINNEHIISNLKIKGENTAVLGNGKIDNLFVYGTNTKVYIEKPENVIINENIEVEFAEETEITFDGPVKSTSQGYVTFKLNRKTDLTLNDISVICNAGKNISVYSLYSADGINYMLSTSYFKNDSYSLYITLPNGNVISRDFDTKYDSPTVSKEVITRESNTNGILELYGIDEGGYIYYFIEEKSKETISELFIKENGIKANIKTGYNKISIDNLKEGIEYNLYYILEGYYGNTGNIMGPLTISSEVVERNEEITINVKEEIRNEIVVEFSKELDTVLTIEDFEIYCPSGTKLTLNEATLTIKDNVYIINIPMNYYHKDNNYTLEVNIGNTVIKGDFLTHFNPPRITGTNTSRNDNTITFDFYSDEAGTVYYGLYEWNGEIYDYNSNTPQGANVLNGTIISNSENLYVGSNRINISLDNYKVTNNTRLWALFVDEIGNYRTGFVDHFDFPLTEEEKNETSKPSIPTDPDPDKPTNPGEEEKPDIPVEESTLKINKINSGTNYISIYLSEEFLSLTIPKEDITLTPITGNILPGYNLSISIISADNNIFLKLEDINNPFVDTSYLSVGTYSISIKVIDKNDKEVILTGEFEVK